MLSNQRNLAIALAAFVLIFFAMLIAALTSKYPATPDKESYDTDPAAITKEEFLDEVRD